MDWLRDIIPWAILALFVILLVISRFLKDPKWSAYVELFAWSVFLTGCGGVIGWLTKG